jgi:hypothetical protein
MNFQINFRLFLVSIGILFGYDVIGQAIGLTSAPIKVNKGQPLTLTTKLIGADTKDYDYKWSGSNSFTSTEKEPVIQKTDSFTVGTPLTYVLTITKTTLPTSTVTATVAVTVLPPQVKIGFEHKSFPVVEGEEIVIGIEALGLIEKDSAVKITYSIKDSDAVEGKDFEILGTKSNILKLRL